MDYSRKEKWGVHTPYSGKVVYASTSQSEYGTRVYIEYPDGFRTIFAHLAELKVKSGDTVHKGQLIGIMGDTGAGLPRPNKHLHFGLIPPNKPLKNLKENCINPVPWLVKDGVYPCNTKVSGAFQEIYSDGRLHEGIDFSGLEINLIDGWENGIMANEVKYYKC